MVEKTFDIKLDNFEELESKSITINYKSVNEENIENKKLVLILHGANPQTQSSNIWADFITVLEEYYNGENNVDLDDFFFVFPDMPGYGSSEKLTSKNNEDSGHDIFVPKLDFSIQTNIVSKFVENFGKDKCILIGKSWGGALSLVFSLRYPDSVDKLILSAPAYCQMFSNDLSDLQNLTKDVLLVWSKDDAVIPISPSSQLLIDAFGSHLYKFIEYLIGNHDSIPPNADSFIKEMIPFLNNL
eukprot:TRINITY_DN4593_c0_g1_i1.p1 TRINITY_DN4593_c0_g1~~TRINITY_DN4593_c0_g1_i1.p1  ORF type:complete len:243 (-),score=71.99 TRINITY_DN4593_c0_g1_i1:284-1012(-)